MIIAAGIGAALGLILVIAMLRSGMLAERSGLAVLLGSVAVFYPVFAAAQSDWAGLVLHSAIFVAFAALALRGWHKGTYLIVGGLIAHGLFDIGIAFIGHPAPDWWPIFCASLDLVVGAILLRLIQVGKVPQ